MTGNQGILISCRLGADFLKDGMRKEFLFF